MPGSSVWIAEIRFEPAVVAKIGSKHGVTTNQVREALTLGAARQVDWHFDPRRGRRLIVSGVAADGRRIIAYLRPVDPDEEIFDCLTAMMEE